MSRSSNMKESGEKEISLTKHLEKISLSGDDMQSLLTYFISFGFRNKLASLVKPSGR